MSDYPADAVEILIGSNPPKPDLAKFFAETIGAKSFEASFVGWTDRLINGEIISIKGHNRSEVSPYTGLDV